MDSSSSMDAHTGQKHSKDRYNIIMPARLNTSLCPGSTCACASVCYIFWFDARITISKMARARRIWDATRRAQPCTLLACTCCSPVPVPVPVPTDTTSPSHASPGCCCWPSASTHERLACLLCRFALIPNEAFDATFGFLLTSSWFRCDAVALGPKRWTSTGQALEHWQVSRAKMKRQCT